MTDDEPAHTPQIPEAVAAPRHRRVLSLVWIVPIVAALVAGWLAVQAFLRQGPTITISFLTAEGLQPGITKLKYKDVEIGTVSALTLSPDRTRVIVTARMQQQASSLLNEDTHFWVVRPRISASSVSGLGTLFSGAYVGVDAGSSAEQRRDFIGLEVPPVVTSGRSGSQYVLKSETLGSLDIGSPVYFRQVQVGQVVAFEIDPDGRGTSVRIFVNAPYDKFVKERSRFWLASGIDASFDAAGFKLNTESLVTVLVGGIAFRTPPESFEQPPAPPSARFDLFPDQSSAERQPDTVVQPAVMVFRESVRGLAVGAPLDFRGIQLGEVKRIEFNYDRSRNQSSIRVHADVYPGRLRSGPPSAPPPADTALIERMIQRGLRAQLRQGNLLTGQLYIALEFVPGRAAAEVSTPKGEILIPTSPSSFTEIQTTLANIAKKLEQFPLDELTRDVRASLHTLSATLTSVDRLAQSADREVAPQLSASLTELRATLATARETLAGARETLAGARDVLAADAPVQAELRDMLREVTRSAEAVRALAETLERQPEALLRGKAVHP
ncbi:MAG: MCE family protein [Burkholderiales bacterium]|nr:MCE family protein [Burkholderiales bacterium]